jgi:hypothetical protein
MKRIAVAACTLFLGAVASAARAAAPAAETAAVDEPRFVTDAVLSPAAQSLALVESAAGERFVSVLELASGVIRSRMSLGREAPADVRWMDEERLAVTLFATARPPGGSGAVDTRYKALVLDTVRQRLAPLEPESRRVAVVDFLTAPPTLRLSDDGVRAYLATQVVSGRMRAALASVNPVSGAGRVVQTAGEAAADWLVDADGRPVALLERAAIDGAWTLWIAGAAGLEERLAGDAADSAPALAGFGPDGDAVLLRVEEGGRTAWRLMSRRDGSLTDVPAAGPYSEPLTGRLTGRVYGFCHPIERRCGFLEPSLQQRWDSVVRAFGDAAVEVVSVSDDFRQLVVLVEGPTAEPVYQLVDFETGEARVIGERSASPAGIP